MRKRIVIILVLSLILSGCTLTSNDREKQNKSKSISQQKVETQEKKLKPAEIIDLKNIKFQFKSLGRLASAKSFVDAFGMHEYVGNKEELEGKVCGWHCGNYWFSHAVTEKPGEECEERLVLFPEYGIKVFNGFWNGKKPSKKEIIENNIISLGDNVSIFPQKKIIISLYKVPEGQTLKETIVTTRPNIKNEKILKYKSKNIKIDTRNTDVYTGRVKKWYAGFGKNINDLNPEDLEIYKSEDNIFLQLKSQPKIFFVFNNYETANPDPICPEYLFDIM